MCIIKKDLTTLESKVDSAEDKLVDDFKTAIENKIKLNKVEKK